MDVCTAEDDFVRDNLRWVVVLNNGQHVFQDDDRPGVEPASAWRRLKEYCHQHNLRIIGMRFQFRSHVVEVGERDAAGYYFARTAIAVSGDRHTWHGYLGGVLLDDGRIRYTHWLTPALIPLEFGVRDLLPEQSECLIDSGDVVQYNRNRPNVSNRGGPNGSHADATQPEDPGQDDAEGFA